MNNYTERFKQIETLEDLFLFNKELQDDAEKYSSLWDKNRNDIKDDNLTRCQEANRFLELVKYRINYLFAKGLSLDKIEVPKTNDKEQPEIAETLIQ